MLLTESEPQTVVRPSPNVSASAAIAQNEIVVTPSAPTSRHAEPECKKTSERQGPVATPKARRFAADHHVDLRTVKGSGPDGAVRISDIEAFLHASGRRQDSEKDYAVVPIVGMRRVIADRMQRSHQCAPQIALTTSIDMNAVQELLLSANPASGAGDARRFTVTAVVLKAVASSLLEHPRINSHLIKDEIHEYQVAHLGIAVALEDGLIVPLIRNVESKTLATIQSEVEDLVARARERHLRAVESQGATFTVSNLGMFGVEQFSAIVNPPEVGILAVGAIKDTPYKFQGGVALRPMMQVTINVDHRAVDGAVAARFLSCLKENLESPPFFTS
jgi:pyruvate dehydrogenase E2 component (dihydrolipoamide acetyltransferase)